MPPGSLALEVHSPAHCNAGREGPLRPALAPGPEGMDTGQVGSRRHEEPQAERAHQLSIGGSGCQYHGAAAAAAALR